MPFSYISASKGWCVRLSKISQIRNFKQSKIKEQYKWKKWLYVVFKILFSSYKVIISYTLFFFFQIENKTNSKRVSDLLIVKAALNWSLLQQAKMIFLKYGRRAYSGVLKIALKAAMWNFPIISFQTFNQFQNNSAWNYS